MIRVVIFLALIACSNSFAETISIWSARSKSFPITPQQVNFRQTVDVEDPFFITLLEAIKPLGSFEIKNQLKDIYEKAKKSQPTGPFFGDVATFLIQDENKTWFYVWYEYQFEPTRLMIFPAVSIAEKPMLFSATSFGQAFQKKSLSDILKPLLPKRVAK